MIWTWYIYYTYINKIRTSRQSPHTHWNPPACRTVLRSFFRIRSSVPRADQARSHSRLTQRWWWCLITGDFKIFRRIPIWLVNSTPLKYINQLGWLFPIYGKIKNVPNHQPDICLSTPPATEQLSVHLTAVLLFRKIICRALYGVMQSSLLDWRISLVFEPWNL